MAESENDVLHVVGGKPLNGTIKVRGAKNFVSKAMVAALLAPGKSVLKNVPEIRDVHVVSDLLRLHGVDVEVDGTNGIVNIDATHVQLADVADVDTLSGSSRIPILFSGPLVHRLGEAFIPALEVARSAAVRLISIWKRCASWVPRSTRSTRTAFTSPLRTACTARRSICRTRPWARPSRRCWPPCSPKARPSCRVPQSSPRSWIWWPCCRRWARSFRWM